MTDTSGNDDAPSFSPNGAQVVFSRDTTGDQQIWTVATGNTPPAEDDDPSTPAGAAAPDGAVRLTDDGDDDTDPSYSPNGGTVVFVQNDDAIITASALTPAGPETTVVAGSVAVSRPVFDPVDATKLLYVSGSHHIILVTGVNGSSPTSYDLSAASGISTAADEWPDWSPNGTTIVFDSTRSVAGAPNGAHQLWTMSYSLSGTNVSATATPVFVNSAGTATYSGYRDIEPVWSPSGDRLAWTRTMTSTQVNEEVLTLAPGNHMTATMTPIDLTAAPTNPANDEPSWTGTDADVQSLSVTVSPGSITLTTPYTSANPYVLPSLSLNSTGTLLTTTGAFPKSSDAPLVVQDSLAGDGNWTVSVTATNLTASGGGLINAQNLGLTGGHLLTISPPFPGSVAFTDNPAASGVAGKATGSQGLANGPHTFAASSGGGDGSASMAGTLTLNAPTDALAGTYTGIITFSVS